MKATLIFVFIACLYTKSIAQNFNIEGKITLNNGSPAVFSSVYANNIYTTVTNENGEYRLNLPPGGYIITCRLPGYKLHTDSINVTNNIIHNVQLQLNQFPPPALQQDSVYQIMKQVIAARVANRNWVTTYSCQVYTKSVQSLMDAPKIFLRNDVAKELNLNPNRRKGIIGLSETIAQFNFEHPDKVHQIVVASKTSGGDNPFNINSAADLQANFYHNILYWEGLSDHAFISPIGDGALSYYHYILAGRFNDNNQVIDAIKVVPKHRNEHLFNGVIYVIENSWQLYAVDLHLYKRNRIDFVDSIGIKQQYLQVKTNVWMPQSLSFNFNGKLIGFKYGGYLLNVYSDYKTPAEFAKGFFNGETLEINKSVYAKDQNYWDQNRAVVLLDDEKNYYQNIAITQKNKKDKTAKDSVQTGNQRFRLLPYLVNGYKLNYPEKKVSWSFDGPRSIVFYNTVEGWGIDIKPKYTRILDDQKKLTVIPDARYGFSDRVFNANVYVNYVYNPFKRASVYGRFGSDFLDLNDAGTIDLFINSLSTLFFADNYLKLYQSKFIMGGTEREVSNGILLNGQLEYAERFSLFNTSLNSFGKDSLQLTSNNPLDPNLNTRLFPNYRAFVFRGSATFTFDQQYSVNSGGKYIEPSKYPRVRINYNKGIQALGSNVNYDFASVDVFQDKLNMGIYGYSSYYFSAGGFFNNKLIYYPDYKQFRGGQSFLFDSTLGNFHFLNFYTYSTDKAYFEAHLEHNFAGYFLSNVPLINRLNLEEIVGGSYLTQNLLPNYEEVYVGLKRTVIRLDYGLAFGKYVNTIQGFRFTYSF
jgi:hypothetical protein